MAILLFPPCRLTRIAPWVHGNNNSSFSHLAFLIGHSAKLRGFGDLPVLHLDVTEALDAFEAPSLTALTRVDLRKQLQINSSTISRQFPDPRTRQPLSLIAAEGRIVPSADICRLGSWPISLARRPARRSPAGQGRGLVDPFGGPFART